MLSDRSNSDSESFCGGRVTLKTFYPPFDSRSGCDGVGYSRACDVNDIRVTNEEAV